jgi:CheY-like chemotaxis protein
MRLEFRKLEAFKDTPIIAVTAFVIKGDEERIIAAGFNNYISKPIKINDLKKSIQK